MISFRARIWIMIALMSGAGILFIYPYTTYDAIRINITREEAEKKAKEFLNKIDINAGEFYIETTVERGGRNSGYLLQKSGNEGFAEKIEAGKMPLIGWQMSFHKNITAFVPQLNYRIFISSDGKLLWYDRTIPDTTAINSLSKSDALTLIENFINKFTGFDVSEFQLTKSKEDNLSQRIDYTFLWEKEETNPPGTYRLSGKVQGNQVGSLGNSFEIPDAEKALLEDNEALLITVSAIIVFFLFQFAIFLFMKKYHEGEIWLKIGVSFFIIYYFISFVELINYWPAVGEGIVTPTGILTKKIIVFIVQGFLVNFIMSSLIFAGWAVGESLTRGVWSSKLSGIDAFMKSKILSLRSGTSYFYGFIIAVILGFTHLISNYFMNTPNAYIFMNPTNMLSVFNSFIPALYVVTSGFTTAVLSSITLTFFAVAITYDKWKSAKLSVVFGGLFYVFGVVIAFVPPAGNVFWLNILFFFLLGAFFAILYIKFDLLTLLSTQFHLYILLSVFVLFNPDNFFYMLNFAGLLLILGIAPVIYILSLMKKEDFVLEDYGVPSHIKRISERERMQKELEIAAKVQLSLLPREAPKLDSYEISCLSLPAREAGGDYYDFVKLEKNKIGIAIGDVSGKGIGAAIYMTLTKGILQAHAEENASPKSVLSKVNKLLYKTIEKNSFVSMIYAVLDTTTHKMIYSRAGHNPAIMGSDREIASRFLKSKGIALGLEYGSIFEQALSEEEINFNVGDEIVLYTDGFTEAMNNKNEEYGEIRFTGIINENLEKPARELISIILEDVHKFTGNHPQHDDMTIVILKRIR